MITYGVVVAVRKASSESLPVRPGRFTAPSPVPGGMIVSPAVAGRQNRGMLDSKFSEESTRRSAFHLPAHQAKTISQDPAFAFIRGW